MSEPRTLTVQHPDEAAREIRRLSGVVDRAKVAWAELASQCEHCLAGRDDRFWSSVGWDYAYHGSPLARCGMTNEDYRVFQVLSRILAEDDPNEGIASQSPEGL